MSEPPSSPYSDQGLIRSVYGPSLLHAAGYGMLAPAIPLFADQLSVSLGLIGALGSSARSTILMLLLRNSAETPVSLAR